MVQSPNMDQAKLLLEKIGLINSKYEKELEDIYRLAKVWMDLERA
ncbi:MAG: hypothetical protein Fur0044_20650 [Anaerolineae bacterium]